MAHRGAVLAGDMVDADMMTMQITLDAKSYYLKETDVSLADKLYAACAVAIDWRDGRCDWPHTVRLLADRGWYGIDEGRNRTVIAYYSGVRFEL